MFQISDSDLYCAITVFCCCYTRNCILPYTTCVHLTPYPQHITHPQMQCVCRVFSAVPIIVINDIKLINNQIFGPMCSSSHQHNYILLFSCSVCQTNLYKSHICIHGMCQSMCEQPQRRQKQRRKFN